MDPACQELFETFTNTDMDYTTAITKFDEHFEVTKNIPYKRHKFNQCTQKQGESINQFVVHLQKLAATFEFSAEKENMI